jgi:hypothetical protein
LFFLALATLNEIVWRTQSTDVWVKFKTFGFLPLTLAFALAQAPLIMRHEAKGEATSEDFWRPFPSSPPRHCDPERSEGEAIHASATAWRCALRRQRT